MSTREQEQVLDTAICEALGMDDAGDVLTGDVKSRRAMRETLARLSAASPHMKPPEALRARILQATATQSYKLEDYRKVGREDYRWYKWGFYAAAVMMMGIAIWEYNVQGKMNALQQQNAQLRSADTQLVAFGKDRNDALAAMVDPHGMQITWNDTKSNRAFGRAVVSGNGSAVLILPKELVNDPSAVPPLTLNINGKTTVFKTTVITAPAKDFGMIVPENAPEIAKMFSVPQQVTPGKPGEPMVAGYNP